MPKRVLIMLGGIAAAGMAVGPQARAQDPRGEQEVSASATREVGTQLVAGFTVQGPFALLLAIAHSILRSLSLYRSVGPGVAYRYADPC